ncbi:MAG: type II secretion system protein GspL, partial [Pseudomonadota bacterium]|nr:type II secretion system protein GspL [Pseudomonadota bacterium]
MSQDLVFLIHPDGSGQWSIMDRESGQRSDSGAFAAEAVLSAVTDAEVERTLVLLPAERIHAGRIELPARSEAEARQAAPFMIEDELAAGLDETEVVIGPRDAGGKRWIYAVDKTYAETVMARLSDALIRPVHILPDAQALADPEAALSLVDRRGDVLFWYADDAGSDLASIGGAVSPGLFPHIAASLVQASGEGQVSVSPSLGLMGERFHNRAVGDADRLASGLPDTMLQGLPALFGERWRSSFDWSDLLRPLRTSAVLASGLVVGYCGLLLGEAFYFQYQAERFDAAAIAEYRALNPQFTRATIPAEVDRLLRNELRDLGGGDSSIFLQLSAALTELVAEDERVRIDSLR